MPVNTEDKYVIDPFYEVDSNGDIMHRTRELWTLGWGEYIED